MIKCKKKCKLNKINKIKERTNKLKVEKKKGKINK